MQNLISDSSIISTHLDAIESFWRLKDIKIPTQNEQYCVKKAPVCIEQIQKECRPIMSPASAVTQKHANQAHCNPNKM